MIGGLYRLLTGVFTDEFRMIIFVDWINSKGKDRIPNMFF